MITVPCPWTPGAGTVAGPAGTPAVVDGGTAEPPGAVSDEG